MAHRSVGIGEGNARLRLEDDGALTLTTVVPDTGTGAHTTLQQVAAEVLQMPPQRIRVKTADTDAFESDSGAGGSRVTHVSGQATAHAASELRQRIVDEAAKILGSVAPDLELGGERVRVRKNGKEVSFAEIARHASQDGKPLETEKRFVADKAANVTAFCAQAAEVEVDPDTGQITILKFVSAHDAGTIINPVGHQGQIDGGLIQGMGLALIEEMKTSDGRVETLNLGDYKLPNIKDIPPLTTVILQEKSGPGPYQAKSIGEGSISPVSPAIANAVFDACGARITDLPITAEKVFFALKGEKAGA
jgi:CO/xanthine dehydrogenase Mo-binding subunit